MKGMFFLFSLVAIAIVYSCNYNSRYTDLNTNKYVNLKKDGISGYMMNSKTGQPVDVYLDTKHTIRFMANRGNC